MTENKWPTKKSVTDAIESIVDEYGCVGGAMVAVQVSYLAEQVQKDMRVIIDERDAEINRLRAEIADCKEMIKLVTKS